MSGYDNHNSTNVPYIGHTEMLEDLVAAAFNDAAHKMEATSKEKMSGITQGMKLPPGMKLPF